MPQLYTTQANVPPDFTDFGVGQPDMNILPLDIMRQAAEHRLSQPDTGILNYGIEAGDGYFLYALANFLTQQYGFPVNYEHLFLNASASQALDMICTLFTKPGDTIFVEEPTYFLARIIFADHELNIISIPVDQYGLRVDLVEEALQTHKPAFIYTIPSFHNPTGFTLTQERREKLVALSQQHGFLIAADEVYQMLYYGDTPPPPSFGAYIDSGTVIAIGTFAKILAPGIRVGWMHTAPQLIKKFFHSGVVESGGSLNHFASSIVRSVLELGLQEQYLAYLRQTYRSRIAAMDGALRQHLVGKVEWTTPEGGYFFWLRLPAGSDAVELRELAKAHKVGFQPGYAFSSQDGLRDYVRLCFAFYDEARIVDGIERLTAVFRQPL